MSLKPNAFGIYDLAGNVSEYCADIGPVDKYWQIVRGAGWSTCWHDGSGFYRSRISRIQKNNLLGFRCVLAPSLPQVPDWTLIKRVDGCVSYDPAKLKIVDIGPNGWLLTDGTVNLQLLDNEQDAQFALAMAKEHTQRCIIGRGHIPTSFEFWSGDSGLKSNGKTPDFRKEDPTVFVIEKHEYSKGDIEWMLVDSRYGASGRFMGFNSEVRAKAVLEAIKQHPRRSTIGGRNKRGPTENGKTRWNPDYAMEYWE